MVGQDVPFSCLLASLLSLELLFAAATMFDGSQHGVIRVTG
jgi:hypothetical protein